MSIIKISSPNPFDGTTSFDKVRFYEATDSSGTGASLLSTESIDTTNITSIDPGFTSYTYVSGSTTRYYAARFYNSSNSNITDYTTWVLGGEDRWDEMFKNELDDTSSTVWTAADRSRFKKWAIREMFPQLYRYVIDTSLTLDNDTNPSHTYTVPFGIFDIAEVGVGDVNNSTSRFQVLHADSWKFENNKLHLLRIPSTESSATIRFIGAKKFYEVGEIPEEYDVIVMHHLKMSAYLNMADDFPRFKTWAQLQEGTRVSFENLRVQAREYERKFIDGKFALEVPKPPSLI